MFFDPLSNDPSASSTTPTKAFRASSKPSTVSPELKNSELVGTMYSPVSYTHLRAHET